MITESRAFALLEPVRLGAILAPNRVLMAPLTRMRSGKNRTPTSLMAEYYTQRASAGLIVSEATSVSQQGTGYPHTPGIYSDEQTAGWRQVAEAVHRAGGRMVLQLWHVGRISHPSFQPGGGLPVAPSALAPRRGEVMTEEGPRPFVVPRALETSELTGIVAQFAEGAARAKAAGFDGVEIHNANGYLLDQFLRDGTNQRTDRYGGSVRNRARLTLEVVDAVVGVWGSERVGIRFSPFGVFNDMEDSNPLVTFSYVLRELNRFNLSYIHLVQATGEDVRHGATATSIVGLRREIAGAVVLNGGMDHTSGCAAVESGLADAIAFGRLFIANPDLPERFRRNAPLNAADDSSFYGGGKEGYTDYPFLAARS